MPRTRGTTNAAGIAIASAALLAARLVGAQAPAPLRTLIVGGGPDRSHNQVAIESNVRYLARLLQASPYHVLFADGDPRTEDVQFRNAEQQLAYRVPDLPRLDGPADYAKIRDEISGLAADVRADRAGTLLLYFTGHGSPDTDRRYANNSFDLWGGETLTVQDLSEALRPIPSATPVVLVMAQCYSGAFANVLFDEGSPTGAPIPQRVAGFFAAAPDRIAAGCTADINEAGYQDFTSYFFAALSGTDRLGHLILGADYDHDGHVGMNEAFAYALLYDESIDTPVCTSDAFLRRYASMPAADIAALPYSTVQGWADPARRAALDGLSMQLDLTGEDRVSEAFSVFARLPRGTASLDATRLVRFVELVRTVALAHALTTSGDPAMQAQYSALVALEHGNPLSGK